MPNWIKKWNVESHSSNRTYVVSIADDGTWGCSCPVWKFRRQICKHIKEVQGNEGTNPIDARSDIMGRLNAINRTASTPKRVRTPKKVAEPKRDVTVTQFALDSVYKVDYESDHSHSFISDLRCIKYSINGGTPEYLFGNDVANYDIADRLRESKVVGKNDLEDHETACSYFYFHSRRQGTRFIERLNKYLRNKAEKMASAIAA